MTLELELSWDLRNQGCERFGIYDHMYFLKIAKIMLYEEGQNLKYYSFWLRASKL